jgi:hypothetical protein
MTHGVVRVKTSVEEDAVNTSKDAAYSSPVPAQDAAYSSPVPAQVPRIARQHTEEHGRNIRDW